MRIRVTASPSRILGHATLVALIAATAAGCSGSDRFATPLFTGSTENQREIIGNSQPIKNCIEQVNQVALIEYLALIFTSSSRGYTKKLARNYIV